MTVATAPERSAHLRRLREFSKAEASAKAKVIEAVRQAKEGGCTWEQIGGALTPTVTRQGALLRYKKHL